MANKSVRIAGIRVDLALGQAEFNKGMDEATRRVVRLENTVKGASKGVNTAFKTIAIGYLAKEILSVSDAISKLAEQGENASSIAEQFKALGGTTDSIDKAKKATIGLLDQYELMGIATKGLSANVKGFNENFGMIADLGARVADSIGGDTAEQIQRLTNLIAKGGKGLSEYGFNLEGLKTKAEKHKAVMEQLPVVVARYAEVTDSAANAQTAYNKALQEGWKEAGIAINTNVGLQESWRNLEKAIDKIDWKRVGEDLATIESVILSLGTTALPTVVRWINEFAIGLDYITGNSAIAKIVKLDEQMESLKDKIANPQHFGLWTRSKDVQEAKRQLAEIEAEKNRMIGAERQKKKEIIDYEEQAERDSLIKKQQFQQKIDEETKKRQHDSAIIAAEKFKESWAKALNSSEQSSLKKQIGDAIEKLDQSSFDSLKEKLRITVEEGFIAGQQDAIDAGAVSLSDVTKQAQVEGDRVISELSESFVEKQQAASRQSIEMWQSLFQNAITGVTFNLKDALEQVAVGFAAKLAQATLGDLGFGKIGSAADLGGALFDQLGLGSVFGNGTAGSGAAGGVGAASAGSLAALVPIAAAAAGAYLMHNEAKNVWKGETDNSAMGTAGRVQLAISTGGLSEVARASGLFGGGKRSPEAEAIHQVAGSLEQLLNKFSTSKTGSGGINLDESKLSGNWSKEMNSWDDQTRTVFSGLGEAVRAVKGITEDVGDEIGFLLGDVFGKDINEARVNVAKLGLTLEDTKTSLMQLGKDEKKSWSEVVTAIQGASEAFKPGLVAIADTKGALDQIVSSGGRGQKALMGVVNAGVEGIEAKLTTLEQLKQKMLADGGNPEYVQALFESINAQGIKSLEELKGVSEEVAANIIAGMEARSPKLAEEWGKMSTDLAKFGADIDNYSSKLDSLNNKKIEVVFDIKSQTDEGAQAVLDSQAYSSTSSSDTAAFASGGVVTGRRTFNYAGGRGMMGEAGPEAILPLTRVNGRLGVVSSGGSGHGRQGVTLVINAPGADPGSEQRIREIASSIQEQAIRGAVEVMTSAGY